MNKMELRVWKYIQLCFGFGFSLTILGLVSEVDWALMLGAMLLGLMLILAQRVGAGYYKKPRGSASMKIEESSRMSYLTLDSDFGVK